MPMYKHILYASELLDENHVVEDRVLELQGLTEAKLSVIHVIEPLPVAYMGGELGAMLENVDTEESLREHAREMLKPIAKRMKISDENVITASGSVGHEILNYAEGNDVDLIVVGSHARHGLELILGSTANSVLHHANCDVLAVRIN